MSKHLTMWDLKPLIEHFQRKCQSAMVLNCCTQTVSKMSSFPADCLLQKWHWKDIVSSLSKLPASFTTGLNRQSLTSLDCDWVPSILCLLACDVLLSGVWIRTKKFHTKIKHKRFECSPLPWVNAHFRSLWKLEQNWREAAVNSDSMTSVWYIGSRTDASFGSPTSACAKIAWNSNPPQKESRICGSSSKSENDEIGNPKSSATTLLGHSSLFVVCMISQSCWIQQQQLIFQDIS